MEWWFAYLLIGALVGFLAGLLGIGGGMVIVPLLVFVFAAKGFADEILMHESLGTAMATILFTSLSSVRAHHQHGGVDWVIARAIAPGILLGGLFRAGDRGAGADATARDVLYRLHVLRRDADVLSHATQGHA